MFICLRLSGRPTTLILKGKAVSPMKKCVLVAEDEKHLATLIKFTLEQNGYFVAAASNGKKALSCCENKRPHLIISDIKMPIMDGIEFKRRLLDSESLAGIPFIFLTARAQNIDVVEGLNLGVNKYITKPFEPNQLLAAVKTALGESCSSGLE